MVGREHARLRYEISIRRQMVPSNLTEFVSHARQWIQLRGFCPHEPSIMIDSFTDWRLERNENQDPANQSTHVEPHDLVMWRTLTIHLLRLQLDLHRHFAALGEKLLLTLRDYAFPPGAACDAATLIEYQRLCFVIWDHPISEPFFSGEQHRHVLGEQGTFPELRLNPAPYHDGVQYAVVERSIRRKDVEELLLPKLIVRELGKKFFYYFESEVGGEVFRRLFPLTPLKKASLVELVKLF